MSIPGITKTDQEAATTRRGTSFLTMLATIAYTILSF
jgi:hypothetical protein